MVRKTEEADLESLPINTQTYQQASGGHARNHRTENAMGSSLIKPVKAPPLSVYVDYTTSEFKVVDNYPLLNPSVTFNTKIGNANLQEHVLAYGTFQRDVNGNGWNYLNVETVDLTNYNIMDSVPADYKPPRNLLESDSNIQADSKKIEIVTERDFDDLVAQQYFRSMEAIGYLEGFATCEIMNEWYVNFYSGLFDGGDPSDESLEFLLSNHDWMVAQSNALWATSDYWRTIRGMLSQLTGIVNGANAGCPGSEGVIETAEKGVYLSSLSKQHSVIHMLLINANGDLYQIADKFNQFDAPASDILEEIPNDDGYFFEINHKNSTFSDSDNKPSTGDRKGGKGQQYDSPSGGKGTGKTGSGKKMETDRERSKRENEAERDADKRHHFYWNREDARVRIENRRRRGERRVEERKLVEAEE
eukprot:gene29175-36179_t